MLQDAQIGGLMQRFNEAVRTGLCRYCGAPAETGSGGYSSVEHEQFNLVCMTCFADQIEFMRRPENALSHFEPGDEVALRKKMAELTDLEKRKEEFIRERIAKRKPDQ